jgi:hypothetical protein
MMQQRPFRDLKIKAKGKEWEIRNTETCLRNFKKGKREEGEQGRG